MSEKTTKKKNLLSLHAEVLFMFHVLNRERTAYVCERLVLKLLTCNIVFITYISRKCFIVHFQKLIQCIMAQQRQ